MSSTLGDLLPHSGIRSFVPPISNFTNGGTLCAQYRQQLADIFVKREDDSGSRSANVSGPHTATGLRDKEKVWETCQAGLGLQATGHTHF